MPSPRNFDAKRRWSVPNGNPDGPPGFRLTLPPGGGAPREAFLLLPGLNLHPDRLSPWREMLAGLGFAVASPWLSGFRSPGDPSAQSIGSRRWFADLDAVVREGEAQLPGIRWSLCGYSLGGLLGLAWARERKAPFARALLLAPALRLKRLHRLAINWGFPLLPGGLSLPSFSPAAYRLSGGTTVSAYRALGELEFGFSAQVEGWISGRDRPGFPLLIAYPPEDELIDTQVFRQLKRAGLENVLLHPLRHRPLPGYPAHLCIDLHTLGGEEWASLIRRAKAWLLEETAPPARREIPPRNGARLAEYPSPDIRTGSGR